ncbi:9736_t:CDS:1, partial [Cetraspora pellucida]
CQNFVASWCLKEKQKKSRTSVKRLTPEIKNLLETMFHTGTASPRNKMSASVMQQELLRRSRKGEINEADIPEVTTISNWISGFSRAWKREMAERSLKEKEK